MNGKIAALGGFVAVTVGLLAWLLLSDTPPPEDFDEDDEQTEVAAAPAERDTPKVKRERVAAENPEESAPKRIDLPKGLPSLNVAPSGEPPPTDPVPPVEPAPAEAGEAEIQEQNMIVTQRAQEAGIRCWEQTREKHPEARGELMARLHLGAGPGGRVVVQNLELDEIGSTHPELTACLDRELMRLPLELPDGIARIVNAPLRLLPEGEASHLPPGSVAPPPGYGHPGETPPEVAAPHAPPASAQPPVAEVESNLAPGQAVAPPPGAIPTPEPPMPPEANDPPPAPDPEDPR